MEESIGKIRRDFHVHKKSIRRIARDRMVSRNTVRKVLRSGRTEFSYVRSDHPMPKMGAYCEQLEALLADNAKRSCKQRSTLRHLHEVLCAAG